LAKWVGEFDVNTLACVARDAGNAALVSLRMGTPAPGDDLRAANVRNWILAERMGYR
jgi:hypothetical protein